MNKFRVSEYKRLCKEYEFELDKKGGNPKSALRNLCIYLDECGYKMPQAKYKYVHEDKRTWMFSDCIVSYSEAKKDFNDIKWIRNPRFIYAQT